ncbi:LLM class flavin-dependent oxidoreductase, partial [Actinomadura sp. NPDC049753]
RRWREAGRPGAPRVVAQAYYALGPDAGAHVREHLGDYYSFAGRLADMMIEGALTTPGRLREAASAFADAGCDELVLVPCAAGPEQLDLLAETLREAA